MIADWDDAYANAPHIPGGEGYPPRWEVLSRAFRESLPAERRREGIAYGSRARERFDRGGGSRIAQCRSRGGSQSPAA